VKITKSQLKQIIKEELEDILNPDSMEEELDEALPLQSSGWSYEKKDLDEEQTGRTVMDDFERYKADLAGMGITITPAKKGDGVSLFTDRNKIANIYYIGKGENRYAVEWLPASNAALRNLLGLSKVDHYGSIQQILSGVLQTTDGPERHVAQTTLSDLTEQ